MAGASPREIGLNLKRARTEAKLTQDAAATAAGISRAAYRSLEAGESAPRASTLLALAKALHVRPDELLRPAIDVCLHAAALPGAEDVHHALGRVGVSRRGRYLVACRARGSRALASPS